MYSPQIESLPDLTPAQQRAVVSLAGFALMVASVSFRAPLWFTAANFGAGSVAGWSAYELDTRGYTRPTWLTIAYVWAVSGVLFALVGTGLGLGILFLALIFVQILNKIQRSEEEAKEYWLDDYERERLKVQNR